MFASFKRPPASTPGNATAGTEKESSGDYTDLEKRADGRWSVQSGPGALKVAVDTDGKTTKRRTCCGFLPAQVGVLLFIMFTLMIGGVLIGVTGMNIARNGVSLVLRGWPWADRYTAGGSMRHVDFLVAAISLSLWAFLFVTCMLGSGRFRCRLRLQPE